MPQHKRNTKTKNNTINSSLNSEQHAIIFDALKHEQTIMQEIDYRENALTKAGLSAEFRLESEQRIAKLKELLFALTRKKLIKIRQANIHINAKPELEKQEALPQYSSATPKLKPAPVQELPDEPEEQENLQNESSPASTENTSSNIESRTFAHFKQEVALIPKVGNVLEIIGQLCAANEVIEDLQASLQERMRAFINAHLKPGMNPVRPETEIHYRIANTHNKTSRGIKKTPKLEFSWRQDSKNETLSFGQKRPQAVNQR